MKKYLLALILPLLLAACAAGVKLDDVPVEDKAGTTVNPNQGQSTVAPVNAMQTKGIDPGRIEGFCRPEDWRRAFTEINDFEAQLAQNGAIVCKFWLQISNQEQLKRFKLRERTRFKRFKITDEDWRNRKKWDSYQEAAADMIERTSTPHAPWTLVAANDKYHARVKVLETVVHALEEALERK